MTDLINSNVSFKATRRASSIEKFKQATDAYYAGVDKALKLDDSLPIFLDTNILLRYYSLSFVARDKLRKFIQKNQKRIFLTDQVQVEFLKNREDVIGRFFEQVTERIPKDYTSDILNKIRNFSEQHKIVLQDYPYVLPSLQEAVNSLSKSLEKLNHDVEQKRLENKNLLLNDSFVDLLSKCPKVISLSESELKLIKGDFDDLARAYGSNSESEISKGKNTFPGLGDIKQKPEDPYGDYIIFHELIKFMITKNVDAIFLTFDNSKGDWMKKDKLPHLQYVQSAFACTGRTLFILDGERTLESVLDVSIESLLVEQQDVPITSDTLQEFLYTYPGFQDADPTNTVYFDDVVDELEMNGYTTINSLAESCLRARKALIEYRKNEGSHLNKLGCLRASLKLVNPNYTGVKGVAAERLRKRYDKYRHLVDS